MNDNQLEMLMKAAQKTFVEELRVKIAEIEEFLDIQMTEHDINKVLRFFHSMNGTASTLGLDYLSSIGREWERKVKELIDQGNKLDKDTLKGIYKAIDSIKMKVDNLVEPSSVRNVSLKNSDYVNMPDRGKILLVDDDIAMLKLLENSFTLEGYTVYICDDSTSAMDTIAVTRPDIIFLDVMMPKLDGYDILSKIKKKPEYADIYIIFLSAKGDVEDRIKGLKAGADDYIAKPFIIGEITTKVEMVMRRSGSYKEKLLKDSLTDAYSRYYFNIRIAEELERYRRNDTIFSIAFIDMDHYKSINDQYGHQTGDHVLKELILHLSKNIRKCDSIYRYGGEEFIILLPETTEESAYLVIDRLRQGFCIEPLLVGGEALNVTFSAGIKQVNDKSESVDDIINYADQAMYYAKKRGRNKVVVYNKDINTQNLKKTILLVDDENTVLKLLKDRLTNIGYNIITAENGRSAVELAKKTHLDAVILDIILPDIDGFEVCKQIKEDVNTQSSKIIMLSKQKQKKNIVKGLYTGADDYITKPFSMLELEARIIKLLNSTN